MLTENLKTLTVFGSLEVLCCIFTGSLLTEEEGLNFLTELSKLSFSSTHLFEDPEFSLCLSSLIIISVFSNTVHIGASAIF